MRIMTGIAVVALALGSCRDGGSPAMNSTGSSQERAVSRQVILAGNSLPFDVLDVTGADGLRIGQQGPLPRFELDLPITNPELPEIPRFQAPTIDSQPELAVVASSDVIYAGRILGTAVDVYLFSYKLAGWQDGEDLDAIAVYVSAVDGELIDLSYVSEEVAPGFNRSSLELEDFVADIFWWGPLKPEVAVATIAVNGEVLAATRTRARFATFDMTGTPRFPDIALAAYDGGGNVTDLVELPGIPPPASLED